MMGMLPLHTVHSFVYFYLQRSCRQLCFLPEPVLPCACATPSPRCLLSLYRTYLRFNSFCFASFRKLLKQQKELVCSTLIQLTLCFPVPLANHICFLAGILHTHKHTHRNGTHFRRMRVNISLPFRISRDYVRQEYVNKPKFCYSNTTVKQT